ncbi:MAG TPA: hypothetical protein VFF06_05165 [Polyangia bacterium]|nr:hypothetical protein [Polyangia bacterium]
MKRATAGWIVAGALVTASLAWMMLRPRPFQGGWKAIDVRASVEASEASVERLNARLDRFVAWSDLRNSERLRFRLWDGRVVGDAKVMADDWDLATYLRALGGVSREELGVQFAIESEPEGERLALSDGKFGGRDRAVRRFLDELGGARPNLEGQFSSLRLEAPGEPAKLRAAMERQLAGFEWTHLTPPLEYAPSAAGTAITARFDGDVRTLVRLLDALQSAVSQGDARLAQLPCTATLDGKQHRDVNLAGFDDWFRLRDELAMSVGPAVR